MLRWALTEAFGVFTLYIVMFEQASQVTPSGYTAPNTKLHAGVERFMAGVMGWMSAGVAVTAAAPGSIAWEPSSAAAAAANAAGSASAASAELASGSGSGIGRTCGSSGSNDCGRR